jgi:hypothetical protein
MKLRYGYFSMIDFNSVTWASRYRIMDVLVEFLKGKLIIILLVPAKAQA